MLQLYIVGSVKCLSYKIQFLLYIVQYVYVRWLKGRNDIKLWQTELIYKYLTPWKSLCYPHINWQRLGKFTLKRFLIIADKYTAE